LTSFLLINFWVTKIGTLKAAFKAFTFNKVSDFWLFLFIILVFSLFYEVDILTINNEAYLYYNSTIRLFNCTINYNELLCMVLLFAAFIKSAQFGMHI
jgi:NADH:ubiquinone oxidoreductase subunit 5 (subunit L)/multisubunit Na+/H+ antiporter MnhA subunit